MDDTEIRPAIVSDLPELVRIYNHYVVHSHVTFDVDSFTPSGRQGWFDGFSRSGPHRLLAASLTSGIAGYASSAPFRPKAAYVRSVEASIYLDPAHVGKGLGRKLYAALLAQLALEPAVHRVYGGIALPNPASVALHESLGFRLTGTLREVGYKFDRYWDVAWYEKAL